MNNAVSSELYAQLLHLNARYALAVDTGDADRVAECFTPDAELSIGGEVVASTAEGIAARLTGRSNPGVLHTSTGLVARHRDDGAIDVSSYFFMFDTRTGQRTASGRYDDVATVADGILQWRGRAVKYTWRAEQPAATAGR